jgi:phytoene dehydrogenase-like protein
VSEAIIIGAGHNGLVCGLMLQRAGRKVTVVERSDVAGGLCAPIAIDDEHTVPGLHHETGTFRRGLASALSLSGLTLESEPQSILATHPEHKGVMLHADASRSRAELDALEKGDGDNYAAYRSFLSRVRAFVLGVLDDKPPAMSPGSLSELVSLGKTGLALRRLGKDDMIELLRVAPMCAADWLNEAFGSELLAAALSVPAIQGTWYGPWSAGTAANLLVHEAARTTHVRGGPAKIASALAQAFESAGGTIKLNSEVQQINIEGGAARGVTLVDGLELAADVVACACDPRTALLDLVPAAELPFDVGEQMRVVRARGTSAKVHLALDGKLEFSGREGERIARATTLTHVDDLERAADAVKYRQMAERPHVDVFVPTVEDASLAPDGHDVVSLLVHFAPYDVEGGWSDETRDQLRDRALAVLEEVAPGTKDKVIASEVLAPPDIEERFGMAGGHVHHVEHALDQLLFMRPAPSVAHYATPLTGLFLCGSGSHPGGGVTGQPGALGAQAILKG